MKRDLKTKREPVEVINKKRHPHSGETPTTRALICIVTMLGRAKTNLFGINFALCSPRTDDRFQVSLNVGK